MSNKAILPSFTVGAPLPTQTSLQILENQKHFLEVNRVEMYTNEEYEKYLQHKEWTRSTTDNLMEYVKQYGMCWEVIHDRLVVYNEFRLTVDAVIERYLQIVLKLAQVRFVEKYPPNMFIHPYDFFPFDRKYEEQRKEDGMKNLLEHVIDNPQAKLFLPSSVLIKKEVDSVMDDTTGSYALLDSLPSGVYSRFQLLSEKTELSKLASYFEKDTSLNLSLLIYPDDEFAKICENIKDTFHKIEEYKRRMEQIKRKSE
ncbi:hypothetical protein EDI_245290 [Entamoeba dispar SAW760]|uniref:dAMP1 SANT/Myb-like domain-containing protein n=1 Tax=Entamoeba dispar (strain ATCC PRA-260 / SAW760) TaxID=370354 RepID=B0EE65_ENTDS|nr:uncharacterized protein EDI_245290 [Entamoeba dispar SAW760]EDR27189.1 hypothetical protein EDI_245290 [Entamoeba dispar SAW760]|eukprot:EDR27189.1 hypothetical protein EDI_245290 [Entamoeba dispar SAW760]